MTINVDDLAVLLGKTRQEVETMLSQEDVIELKLTERATASKQKEKLIIA